MRSWAEINISAIEDNIKNIREITNPSSKIMAVIKADAYGHGVYEVAKALISNGADCFGVATINEALEIRQSGFLEDILVLSPIPEENIEDAVNNNITLTVCSYDYASVVSKKASKTGGLAKIHIKLDTGMSRIGFVADDVENAEIVEEILNISKLSNIFIEGTFSHFSTADETDSEYTHLQFKRFMAVCDALSHKGLEIPVKHIANSAAIMMYPEYHLDMVRPGIILYGLYPSHEVDRGKLKLTPAMTLKSKITYIKTLSENRGVSYGKEYITENECKVATIPIGYADGYARGLAKSGEMLVSGSRVKIIGRICMDQCMIDVTNVNNTNIGDEVTLFSERGITADDLASWLGTINYEIVCMISKRIPRIYLRNGRRIKG